jgi:hypothetical protein
MSGTFLFLLHFALQTHQIGHVHFVEPSLTSTYQEALCSFLSIRCDTSKTTRKYSVSRRIVNFEDVYHPDLFLYTQQVHLLKKKCQKSAPSAPCQQLLFKIAGSMSYVLAAVFSSSSHLGNAVALLWNYTLEIWTITKTSRTPLNVVLSSPG